MSTEKVHNIPLSVTEETNQGLLFIHELYGESSLKVNTFMTCILSYGKGTTTLSEVISQVNSLFLDNEELLKRFYQFLPFQSIPNVIANEPNMAKIDGLDAQSYIDHIRNCYPLNESNTYNQFQSLLQSYTENKIDLETIKEKINVLFASHPELIRDFNSFLPPNVRESKRALIDTVSVQPPQEAPLSQPYSSYYQQPPYIPVPIPAIPIKDDIANESSLPVASSSAIASATSPAIVTTESPSAIVSATSPAIATTASPAIATTASPAIVSATSPASSPSYKEGKSPVSISSADMRFFMSIRHEGGDAKYHVYIKLCMLFAKKIISMAEFVSLFETLYEDNHSIIHTIRELLLQHGIPAEFITHNPSALLPEQVKQLSRCSPSYHHLPSEYLQRGGSYRTFNEGKILNDNWISCPIGSEEFTSGLSHRNTYADALFRVEDDRFEADIIVETNRHCLGRLEGLYHELCEKQDDVKMNDNALSDVDKRAIRRLYGKDVDEIVMMMLKLSPRSTIPIILKRMREKEAEWVKEKSLLDSKWRKIQSENYNRSLDTRSYTFKTQDKKNIGSKIFLDNIKTIVTNRIKDIPPSQYLRLKEQGYDNQSFHLHFTLNNTIIHTIAIRLLLAGGKKSLPYADMKRFRTMLQYCVCDLFHIDPSILTKCEELNELFLLNHDTMDTSLQFECSTETTKTESDDTKSIFVNNSLYIFYRYYEVLYSRLYTVAKLCVAAANHMGEFQISHTVKREANMDDVKDTYSTDERLNHVINNILLLLRGEEDSVQFEENSRQLVGAGGYVLYTVDKVIGSCMKNVHNMFNDVINNDLIACYAYYHQPSCTLSLPSYRDHSIHLLANYRLIMYRITINNGDMKIWMVGNASELQQTHDMLPNTDEFNKFARDFLSVQSSSSRVAKKDLHSFIDDPMEEDPFIDSSDTYSHTKKRKRTNNKRAYRKKEDGDWNDY